MGSVLWHRDNLALSRAEGGDGLRRGDCAAGD